MAFTQKQIHEFTPGAVVNDADLIPYSQGGVTKQVPFGTLKTTIPNYGYLTAEFVNGDLSGNVLTINHAKNTNLVEVKIFNPGGVRQYVPYTIVDVNNVSINFGGVIEEGNWYYELDYWGGVGVGYPDPSYEPALTKEALSLNTATKNANLTINSALFYRYGNLLIGTMRITSAAQFLRTGSGAIVGVLPVLSSVGTTFPGSPYEANAFENCNGTISGTGEIKIYCGRAALSFVFNFTHIII